MTQALLERRLLERHEDAFRVTGAGRVWLGELGIELAAVERQRRSFARACLDWTERRPHLAGALGAALAEVFFTRGWVRRLPGGRAVTVTPAGREWVARENRPHGCLKLGRREPERGLGSCGPDDVGLSIPAGRRTPPSYASSAAGGCRWRTTVRRM